jgi:glycosyltransferase involved in cell wall biosynthesis
MSVYNGETYLNEAINSILNQTYTDFEFIIINDGSTDKSWSIIEENSKNDARIVPINQENMGLTRSLNKAVSLARGQYIARMDDSDISMPNRIKNQVEFLNFNKSYDLVGTHHLIINEKSEVINEANTKYSHEAIMSLLQRRNQFAHGSLLFTKGIFNQVGGYRNFFIYTQDYDFLLRIINLCKVKNLNYVGYKWRDEGKRKNFSREVKRTYYRTLSRLLYYERTVFGNEITLQYINKPKGVTRVVKHLSSYLQGLKKSAKKNVSPIGYRLNFFVTAFLFISGTETLVFTIKYRWVYLMNKAKRL